jgi:probable F420-dependent oxidoreductase
MQVGVVFPQYEIGNDPMVIRDFAQAAEEVGFTHLLVYDHVLGADPDRPGGWQGPYNHHHAFHEPFVLFGFLAAHTRHIEFVTTVLVLPQRQTALVAKQAAEVDLLSSGRLRLGVGSGWNAVEFEALGIPFEARGAREEEQVALMRELWSQDVVTFEGKFHRIDRAGIKPRPRRPIPIWFGGGADPLLRRAARIGDGWMPLGSPGDKTRAMLDALHRYRKEAGRDDRPFGIQAQAQIRGGDPERWRQHAARWRGLGATHLAIATMDAGLASPEDHIEAARRYYEAVQD